MKKRGFTLIELMIVLAIIAILAVVIVPKSGIFKKNAKTAGVTTNMNTVRAYLETKTAENALDAPGLQKAMTKNFKDDTEDAIKNPKDNNTSIVLSTSVGTTPSVIISTKKPTTFRAGTVIVYVGEYTMDDNKPKPVGTGETGTDGYIVYGVDLDGNLLGNSYAIEK